MWTGDISPHDIWNVTRHEVLSQIQLVTNMIKQYTRVPVYPVIGNHEGVPVNRSDIKLILSSFI
jgi:sphingomyelin phosphodiesterase